MKRDAHQAACDAREDARQQRDIWDKRFQHLDNHTRMLAAKHRPFVQPTFGGDSSHAGDGASDGEVDGGLHAISPGDIFHLLVSHFAPGQGLDNPQNSQLDVIELAMRGECGVVVDPPGSGKTWGQLFAALAYGYMQWRVSALPGVVAAADSSKSASSGDFPYEGSRTVSVFVVPTRELVKQVFERIEQLLGKGSVACARHHADGSMASSSSWPPGALGREAAATEEGSQSKPILSLQCAFAQGGLEAQLLREESTVRVVVVTPEGATEHTFTQCTRALQEQGRFGYYMIDEAHLLGQWGQKFRHRYLKLQQAMDATFEGYVDALGRAVVRAILLSGSMNRPKMERAAALAGLDPARTTFILRSLDPGAKLKITVLDLNDVNGTHKEIVAEGARRMIPGVLMSLGLAIVFCSTAADCRDVAQIMNSHVEIEAEAFYRRLDDVTEEETGAEVAAIPGPAEGHGRAGALARWRGACARGKIGVLVSTVLAVHGIDEKDVDWTGQLVQWGEFETLLQALGRIRIASRGNWIASHPLLMGSAAFFVDFSDGAEASSYRDMAALHEVGGVDCRRACLLEMLGSPMRNPCSGCDRCHPELAAYPSIRYETLDATAGAIALLEELIELETRNSKAWFVSFVSRGKWRQKCTSTAEAHAVAMRLYVIGAINLGTEDLPSSPVKAMTVAVSREKSAKILNLMEPVIVWCASTSG